MLERERERERVSEKDEKRRDRLIMIRRADARRKGGEHVTLGFGGGESTMREIFFWFVVCGVEGRA